MTKLESGDGRIINKDSFEFGQILGEGGFGQVRLVVSKDTNVQYAAKILIKEKLIKAKQVCITLVSHQYGLTEIDIDRLFFFCSIQTKYVKSEKDILLSLAHPNVSKLYFTFADQKRLYFIMELITGGEFFSAIRKVYCPTLRCSMNSQLYLTIAQCYSSIPTRSILRLQNFILLNCAMLYSIYIRRMLCIETWYVEKFGLTGRKEIYSNTNYRLTNG